MQISCYSLIFCTLVAGINGTSFRQWIPGSTSVTDTLGEKYYFPIGGEFEVIKLIEISPFHAIVAVKYREQDFVMRITTKARGDAHYVEQVHLKLFSQVSVLSALRYQPITSWIVNLDGVFESEHCVYMLLERYSHMNTLESIVKEASVKGIQGFDEASAAGIMKSMLEVLVELHSRNVAHGNVGLHSIFIDLDLNAKLGNFEGALVENTKTAVEQVQMVKKMDVQELGYSLYQLFSGSSDWTEYLAGKAIMPPSLTEYARELLEACRLGEPISHVAALPWWDHARPEYGPEPIGQTVF